MLLLYNVCYSFCVLIMTVDACGRLLTATARGLLPCASTSRHEVDRGTFLFIYMGM